MGLIMEQNEAKEMFSGIPALHESSAYKAILDIGRDEEREVRTKTLILRLARRKLGEADESVRARLDAINDLERLERLFDRAADAPTWDDLLATP
jgi:hypothetical protein